MSKKLQELEAKKAALLEKQKQAQARIDAQIKAAEKKEKDKARKLDTRRKVLAGAFMLHHCEVNKESELSKKLFALLDEYLIKDIDRELFELSPIPETEQKLRTEQLKKQREIIQANKKAAQ